MLAEFEEKQRAKRGQTHFPAWEKEIADAEAELVARVKSYQGSIDVTGHVASKNIGRGADWAVLVLTFVIAAHLIPNAHKKIRDAKNNQRILVS